MSNMEPQLVLVNVRVMQYSYNNAKAIVNKRSSFCGETCQYWLNPHCIGMKSCVSQVEQFGIMPLMLSWPGLSFPRSLSLWLRDTRAQGGLAASTGRREAALGLK